MAPVPEEVPKAFCWRATSSHTLPWSDLCPSFSFRAWLTDDFRKYRSFDDEWLPLEPKCLERYRHRPCSTQLTGILTLLLAAIRTDVFSTRFCFAPTNSSPSRKSTRTSPLFSTRRFGDRSALGNFLDGHGPGADAFVGKKILDRRLLAVKERENGQRLAANGLAYSDMGKCNGHDCASWEKGICAQ